MAVDWTLRYDRCVGVDFLSLFQPGGVAHPLVEYARHAPYAVDLQLRKDPKTSAQHAALYVGLTAVLTVNWRGAGRFALSANPTWSAGPYGFDAGWANPAGEESWRQRWPAVERYLEAVIPAAARGYASREGGVQAAVASFATPSRVVLDREVIVCFRDQPTRSDVLGQVTGPVLSALAGAAVPGRPPASLGDECDLLALDDGGRLLAIEVKPSGAGSIAWAAAQATVYAAVLRRWWREDPPAAKGTVECMLQQRRALGLVPDTHLVVGGRPDIVPVVAVQRGASTEHLRRLFAVQRSLCEAGVGDPALEVYSVNLAGRLDRIASPDLVRS